MFARTFIAAVLLPAAAFPMAAKELKVLMIGNSFSICVGRNLPQIVSKDADNKLVLTSAYIGGCTFDRHYNYLATADIIAIKQIIDQINTIGNPTKNFFIKTSNPK